MHTPLQARTPDLRKDEQRDLQALWGREGTLQHHSPENSVA